MNNKKIIATDRTINLCDSCQNNDYPQCLPDIDEVEYGEGFGLDNIISCTNYRGNILMREIDK